MKGFIEQEDSWVEIKVDSKLKVDEQAKLI